MVIRVICNSNLFEVKIKLLTKRIKLNLLFKLSYLNSNFELTLGYLNPALNNSAQVSWTAIVAFFNMNYSRGGGYLG